MRWAAPIALSGLYALASVARAAPTVWRSADGGNGHAYAVVRLATTRTDWNAARESASTRRFGGAAGHLVTITSPAENAFVVDLLNVVLENEPPPTRPTALWIGGMRSAVDAGWSWVTAEPWDYTNWAAGSPGVESAFVRMLGEPIDGVVGRWTDDASAETNGWAIVEYDLETIDCNDNGVADYDEVREPVAFSFDAVGFSGTNAAVVYFVVAPPAASGDVTLSLTVRAGLSSTDHFMDVEVNAVPVGRLFEVGAGDCSETPDEAAIVLTADFFNFLLAGENLLIRVSALDEVGSLDACPTAFVRLVITYEAEKDDCNRNGVPDACDVASAVSHDCNGNGRPDECEEDCNANGLADECDIAAGTSDDCNGNGVPDACENDCDGNGVPDDCDLAVGTSHDCNNNAVPDVCERDCNRNGVHDSCDVRDGTSVDCDRNGVPDECQPDCNGNGVADPCDLAAGTSDDCDLNQEPDECRLADNDCNGNGILDVCDTYGQARGADACFDADAVCPGITYVGTTNEATNDGATACSPGGGRDVWYTYTPVTDGVLTVSSCGSSFDTVVSVHLDCEAGRTEPLTCNDDACGSASQLSLAVAAGTTYRIRVSGFRTRSGVYRLELEGPPCRTRERSADCNRNGVPDACDIATGSTDDCNVNGIPDACELADPTPVAETAACPQAGDACPGVRYIGTTIGAVSDGADVCGSGDSPAVWYSYTPASDGRLIVSLCGSSFDTVLSAHSACRVDGGDVIVCNDDACGGQSEVSLDVLAGLTYFIRVSGIGFDIAAFGGPSGSYVLVLTGPDCAGEARDGDCNANRVPDSCDLADGLESESDDGPNVCLTSVTPADADRDGDVDLADFLVFQNCFSAPANERTTSTACRHTDLDGDGDLDLADLVVFQARFTGAR